MLKSVLLILLISLGLLVYPYVKEWVSVDDTNSFNQASRMNPQVPPETYFDWLNFYNPAVKINGSSFNYRVHLYGMSAAKIREHNSNPDVSYKLGVNQFSIINDAQFIELFLMKIDANIIKADKHDVGVPSETKAIDWISKGVVSPVKDQMQCGSSWIYASVAALESLSRIQNHHNQFSQIQLIHCGFEAERKICAGGLPHQAFDYVVSNGISKANEYEINPFSPQSCSKKGGKFKIASVSKGSGCEQLYAALAKQPVVVMVDASKWRMYSSGVLVDYSSKPNHALLLVGVTEEYWVLKNSFGTTWGEAGFIKLDSGNTCGICMSQFFVPLKNK